MSSVSVYGLIKLIVLMILHNGYAKKLQCISVCSVLRLTTATTLKLSEAGHEISNNVVCANSKASDQLAHTRSLIRAFASCLNIL